jgi:hypothetical protein
MRFTKFGFSLFLSLLGVALWGQTATTTGATQDPKAISILTQALTVAGGAQAINSVSDYTATGNITYYTGDPINGTVTLAGLGLLSFRLDATLPSGVRSWAVQNGVITNKSETGAVSSTATPKVVPSSEAVTYRSPLFPNAIAFPTRPLLNLTTVGNQRYGLFYQGEVQVDGETVYDVQIQVMLPPSSSSQSSAAPLRTRDLLIDASTFQIVRVIEEYVPHVRHEYRYSDYQAVKSVLFPFAIAEYIGGQAVSSIQLNSVALNQGLQTSSFALQ